MVGEDDNEELQVTHSRNSGLDVSSPHHGKVFITYTLLMDQWTFQCT